MQVRLINFYKINLFWRLMSILNTYNYSKTPLLSKIILTIYLKNVIKMEDINNSKALFILETISNQKPFIKLKTNTNNKITKNSVNFLVKVVLRKVSMWSFFDFFFLFIVLILHQKFIKINEKFLNTSIFSIIIKDLTVFPQLNVIGLNWQFPLKIDFILKNSNETKSFVFFKHLGF